VVTVSPFAAARDLAQSHSHITKAVVAAMWTYGGRGIGLLWTLILIAKLGIGGYGQYAMAFALAAIAAAPVDNPFSVRAIRESESRFLSERSGRVLVGLTAMVAGVALIGVNYLAWFALLVGGGEVVFNAYKSRAFRDGDPHRVMRMDTIRQTTSIALGTGYLMLAPQPSLVGASLLYAAPYLVIACASVRMVWGVAPKAPGTPRIIAILFTEHLANAVYIQGDILLLGFLTNSDVAGYYSVASTFAWAVAQIGQSFGVTYHEKLRAAGGHASAGPPKKHVFIVATGASLALLIVGVVLLFTPVATELAVSIDCDVGVRVLAGVQLRLYDAAVSTTARRGAHHLGGRCRAGQTRTGRRLGDGRAWCCLGRDCVGCRRRTVARGAQPCLSFSPTGIGRRCRDAGRYRRDAERYRRDTSASTRRSTSS